jgi:predicted small secreted protein
MTYSKNKNKIPVVLMLAVAIFCATGCSMMAGLGKDIQSGGRAVENAARTN